MEKYVIFSFDDGRANQYYNAFFILKQFEFAATINIVSDFLDKKQTFSEFETCQNESISWDEAFQMSNEGGWEIACHGANHSNTVEGILQWLSNDSVQKFGWDKNAGFASPHSYLTESNANDIMKLISSGQISYIRTGKQVRREGFWFAATTYINRYLKSKLLFYLLNRNCILSEQKNILLSVGITKYDSVKELVYLIDKMQDGQAIILMFHSILDSNNTSNDIWSWTSDKLMELCEEIKKRKEIIVCTTSEWRNKKCIR